MESEKTNKNVIGENKIREDKQNGIRGDGHKLNQRRHKNGIRNDKKME